MTVASILKGKTVPAGVSLVIAPGSKQVLTMLAENGALADMVKAGARILESACGPCIGMGQAPATDAVSLRTFNRNFHGRSGTASANIYLVSPEVAAASALAGMLIDPTTLGDAPNVEQPRSFVVNANMVVPPADHGEDVQVVRGPNIKPFPVNQELAKDLSGKILIKLGDNITTDHIMPSTAKLLPFRSNVPYLAGFCLTPCDPDFPKRARENGGGFIVGGSNYGQGSSREHAALAPVELGIKAVVAKSFARIHRANLINNGILPLTFQKEKDYHLIEQGDEVSIANIGRQLVENPQQIIIMVNSTKNLAIPLRADLTERQLEMILAGGLLNLTKKSGN